ncbi:MAG: S41 family peptidase [Candidatus Delongbacteria bacterium]|nr:S41 family peptidase [Candidatus Delongbacteria bacterium]MBN2833986.1 S41 family peptidase [Candidatus Delongbacteria bacterium]
MLGKKFYMFTVFLFILAISVSYRHDEADAAQQKSDYYSWFEKLSRIVNLVDQVYVEDFDKDKVMEGAVEGLLKELDPHSYYISPEKQKSEEEDFNGEFGGIGIEFEIKDKYLTVITAIPETPSDELGLQPGDRIVKIDGESAFDITTEQVFKRLKGPLGSNVNITISREGVDKLLEYTIQRAAIPIKSVIAQCMVDNQTGFVKINRFAKKTAEELKEALILLKAQGMQRLVLDLRNNPGGLMDQAVEIVDMFLSGGKKIVYTKGRISQFNEEYFSSSETEKENCPLIILIDAGSASASEIVSGSLQDNDRAYIIGAKSFGKGLVQRPFPLGDGSVVRITIARYYTPTGRLIQRPYDKGITNYYLDRFRNEDDLTEKEKFEKDSMKKANTYYTLNKNRVVYGGGGITPDSIVLYDPTSRIIEDLYRKRVFSDFAINYFNHHKSSLPSWSNDFDKFRAVFNIDESIKSDFISLCEKSGIKITDKEINKDEREKDVDYYTIEEFDKDFHEISVDLKYHIGKQFFNDISLYPRVKYEDDKHVKVALDMFDKIDMMNE